MKEVQDCLGWSGKRPVEWFLRNQPVNERWCLIHATHLTPEETNALAKSGAVAGLCPITEANLGDGVFPGVDFLAAGGRFGVGRIRMSRSRHRASCGCWNTASASRAACAMR